MHLLEAIRAAVLVLLVAAVALGTVALARLSSPTATIVVVPISAPLVERTEVPVPAWCYGYDWRRSSVDLRWYCGYRD